MKQRPPEKQAAIEEKRRKRHEKREAERHQDGVRKNFGFDDSQRVEVCEICGEETDVYPAKIEGLPQYRTRLTGSMVKKICVGCDEKLVNQGARLVRGGLEEFGLPSTGNVYDNKPRHRIG